MFYGYVSAHCFEFDCYVSACCFVFDYYAIALCLVMCLMGNVCALYRVLFFMVMLPSAVLCCV